MIADILTKPLQGPQFFKLRALILGIEYMRISPMGPWIVFEGVCSINLYLTTRNISPTHFRSALLIIYIIRYDM